MAYCPQANGKAERMVKTLTRALKMYVVEADQHDWDEYAERLDFAINLSYDRVRGDTPFYLAYGWDPRSTMEAAISIGCTKSRDRDARRCRMEMQRHYSLAREQVNERLRKSIQDRADQNYDHVKEHGIEPGSQVWLYLDRVKEGYARKLAHMWQGPFRVAGMVGEDAVKLVTTGTDYNVFPIMHVSKLKLARHFPDRPSTRLVLGSDRFNFDEALPLEDSWDKPLDPDEYEVEKILDV